MTPAPLTKPLLRGVSHQIAAGFALAAWVAVAHAARGTVAEAGANIYGASLFTLFTVSALYHRKHWTPRARYWMGQVDYSAIYVLIAGTCTPFCLLLDRSHATTMLAFIWGVAGLGILKELVWTRTPKVLAAVIYVAMGWTFVLTIPTLTAVLGAQPVHLLLAGGVVYSLGAAVYAVRRPNPFPRVFGYHEVFHIMVIVAAVLHFVAAASAVRALGLGG